jgi:hypothetical protein
MGTGLKSLPTHRDAPTIWPSHPFANRTNLHTRCGNHAFRSAPDAAHEGAHTIALLEDDARDGYQERTRSAQARAASFSGGVASQPRRRS